MIVQLLKADRGKSYNGVTNVSDECWYRGNFHPSPCQAIYNRSYKLFHGLYPALDDEGGATDTDFPSGGMTLAEGSKGMRFSRPNSEAYSPVNTKIRDWPFRALILSVEHLHPKGLSGKSLF